MKTRTYFTESLSGVTKVCSTAVALGILASGYVTAEEMQAPADIAAIRKAFLESAKQKKVLRIGLVDCVLYALRKNSDIRIARVEPKIKSDDVRIAQSEFEPTLNAEYNLHDKTTESTNVFFPVDSKIRDINFDADISGKLPLGTEYDLSFLNERYRSNADIDTINPYFSVEPIVTITQPLLRGFGMTVNLADVHIARNNHKQSQEQFRRVVIDSISQAKTAYYNLYSTRDGYAIAEMFRKLAQDLLEINKARYAKGLVSSVDVLETEAAAAEREKTLLSAEEAMKRAEDDLKLVLNLGEDPELWNAQVELLDKLELAVEKPDLIKSINDAFVNRPDYQARLIDLKNRDIKIKVKRNALFPTLDAMGSLGMNGIDGTYASALNKVNKNFIDWSVGGKLTVPWGKGDRARFDQAKLEKARAILDLQKLEQDIIFAVRDKVRDVDIQFRQERASRVSMEKEKMNYAAQTERYAAGHVSTHDMLDYQEKLSRAEFDHTKALVDYDIALVNLDRETGLTLIKNNVKIEEQYNDAKKQVAISSTPAVSVPW
ncbi:MAG: TolC family protein [bacterium]